MNGRPVLVEVARAAGAESRSSADRNAAAARQGAPVTTVDFDFFFRKTSVNVRKLTALAAALDAVVIQPHYPVPGLLRLIRERDALQLDFMSAIHGVRSFKGLRARGQAARSGRPRCP